MPVYGYVCKGCGHGFEFLQISAEEKVKCPSCRSRRVTQLPVLRSAFQTSMGRERRVVDMSSGMCPCGCGKARHAGGFRATGFG